MIKAIRPQPGPQTDFMASSADIVIYGGSAGGGKSYALLMEPLRYMRNRKYNALIFRHSYTQVTAPGGLWDTARNIYGSVRGAWPSKTPKLHWTFRSGATVNFAHLTRDEDVESWQGSQIVYIGWDELTHFSDYQFFYMLSRNRSDSGIKPYIRATCNPDPDSWVKTFISWWIDKDTGYAIDERSGVIRYMARKDGNITWADTKEDLLERGFEDYEVKSVTFIKSSLSDNKILMEIDPSYLSNLNNLPYVERERLLNGNWNIRNKSGLMFQRGQVKLVDRELINKAEIVQYVRAWDLAATTEDENGDPAYTAGVLVGMTADNRYKVLDVINMRLSAGDVESLIINTAKTDRASYGYVRNRVPQDPGQAGKSQAQHYVQTLASQGFDIVARTETGNKEHRATPVAALWQHGFVDVVTGDWNDSYFSQLEGFPETKFKDMVDATSSAFDELMNYMGFNLDNML